MYTIKPIGFVYSGYDTFRGTPKRPDYDHETCIVEIDKTYLGALKNIDEFSYIYLICFLDRVEKYLETVCPPQDNVQRGIFSTRSPFRPNPISLTRVKLEKRKGNILFVTGVDLMNRTPVIDIKPYTGRIPKEDGLRFGCYG